MLVGWKGAALPDNIFGFLSIYVLGPIVGASFAAVVFTYLIEPLMQGKGKNNDTCVCK